MSLPRRKATVVRRPCVDLIRRCGAQAWGQREGDRHLPVVKIRQLSGPQHVLL